MIGKVNSSFKRIITTSPDVTVLTSWVDGLIKIFLAHKKLMYLEKRKFFHQKMEIRARWTAY